jgi:simple sugar transport system permease protein
LGRKIYCVGGNPASSERLGFNNAAVLLFVYAFAGALAGTVGVMHASFQRMSNPFDLVGGELNVIAAVVIGGPRVGGGYGNTVGTMLGVLLITLINNSLVMLKIPTFWQKATIGFIIIAGTAAQLYRYKKNLKV